MSVPVRGPGAWGADVREGAAWLRRAPGFVAAAARLDPVQAIQEP